MHLSETTFLFLLERYENNNAKVSILRNKKTTQKTRKHKNEENKKQVRRYFI